MTNKRSPETSESSESSCCVKSRKVQKARKQASGTNERTKAERTNERKRNERTNKRTNERTNERAAAAAAAAAHFSFLISHYSFSFLISHFRSIFQEVSFLSLVGGSRTDFMCVRALPYRNVYIVHCIACVRAFVRAFVRSCVCTNEWCTPHTHTAPIQQQPTQLSQPPFQSIQTTDDRHTNEQRRRRTTTTTTHGNTKHHLRRPTSYGTVPTACFQLRQPRDDDE